MKVLHAMIIVLLFMFAATPLLSETDPGFIPSTNTEATPAAVMVEINDVKFVVAQWKDFGQLIKKSGFGIAILPTLLMLIMISLVILAVCFNIILNFIELFTPPEVDKKLDKIEKWIEDYLIRYPYLVIQKLRGVVKKK